MSSYKILKGKQVFQSGEYSIEPIRYDDRFDIMKWRNEQMYHLRQSNFLSREDQNYYFDNVISELFKSEKPNQILFSYLKDRICIGYGGLVHINWIDKNAEISFIMNTALEASQFEFHWENYLSMISKVAFGALDLNKIYTYAFDLRPKLYNALQNSGFELDAILKKQVLFENKYIDVVIHAKWNDLSLRKAESKDAELTYRWAQDGAVRKYALNSSDIQWKDHQTWFTDKLTSRDCQYYIVQTKTSDVGSIRLDIEGKVATISYLVDPKYHGYGYGYRALKLLETEISHRQGMINSLQGVVMEGNLSSIRIFEKLNYKCEHKEDLRIYTKLI